MTELSDFLDNLDYAETREIIPGRYDPARIVAVTPTLHITQRERAKLHNKLLEKQKGRCAICEHPQGEFSKVFTIDHDHKTGKIRGLLCSNCNTAIGLFYENQKSLQNAIEYLNIDNKTFQEHLDKIFKRNDT